MQYQKTIWKKGDRIKAKALNNLEDGVADNTACLNNFSQGFAYDANRYPKVLYE